MAFKMWLKHPLMHFTLFLLNNRLKDLKEKDRIIQIITDKYQRKDTDLVRHMTMEKAANIYKLSTHIQINRIRTLTAIIKLREELKK